MMSCWRLRQWLAFFSNKIFLIKVLILFFRHNAITRLIDYIINVLSYALGKQKIRVTHVIVILALLWWSGTNLQYL